MKNHSSDLDSPASQCLDTTSRRAAYLEITGDVPHPQARLEQGEGDETRHRHCHQHARREGLHISGVPLLDIPAPRWVCMVKTIRAIANP